MEENTFNIKCTMVLLFIVILFIYVLFGRFWLDWALFENDWKKLMIFLGKHC